MKRFTVPCTFGNAEAPFHVFIASPCPDKHPLYYQQFWLYNERGGEIPEDIIDSFTKLRSIAKEHNVSFEDLCVHALGNANAIPVIDEKLLKAKIVDLKTYKKERRKKQESIEKEHSSTKTPEFPAFSYRNYTYTPSRDADLLIYKTREKNISFLNLFCQYLLPDNASCFSRSLLYAYMLRHSDYGHLTASLAAVYDTLSVEDVHYNIAVLLDTEGSILTKFIRHSLVAFLNASAQERKTAVAAIVSRLYEFSLEKLPAKLSQHYTLLQDNLRNHLFTLPPLTT